MTTTSPTRRPQRRPATAAGATMPAPVAPMLAVPAGLPPDDGSWAFEYKWDGVRAVARFDGRGIRVDSRNLLDITPRYPELYPLADALRGRSAVLDGEIVALDDIGRPSFARLQRRMHLTDPREIARHAAAAPVWYALFDVVYLDGRWVGDRPYADRRGLLEGLTVAGPHWQVGPSHVGRGAAMLDAARQNGLEGLVAKRVDGPYEPGRRSPHWRKVKIVHRQELVVGGWAPEQGTAPADGRVGAMLTGYYDCDGRLRLAGRVGTGLVAADHPALVRRFTRRMTSPFADPVPKRGVVFVEPTVVIDVEYRRWPDGGLIQHAAYKGTRADKDPRDVIREISSHNVRGMAD